MQEYVTVCLRSWIIVHHAILPYLKIIPTANLLPSFGIPLKILHNKLANIQRRSTNQQSSKAKPG